MRMTFKTCPIHKKKHNPLCKACVVLKGSKKLKFKNKPTKIKGESFPSMLEADVFSVLKIWETQGWVTDIRRYPSVKLPAGITWKVDAVAYVKGLQKLVYFEPKGCETSDFAIKFKLFGEFGDSPLVIVKAVKGMTLMISKTANPPYGIKQGDALQLHKVIGS